MESGGNEGSEGSGDMDFEDSDSQPDVRPIIVNDAGLGLPPKRAETTPAEEWDLYDPTQPEGPQDEDEYSTYYPMLHGSGFG